MCTHFIRLYTGFRCVRANRQHGCSSPLARFFHCGTVFTGMTSGLLAGASDTEDKNMASGGRGPVPIPQQSPFLARRRLGLSIANRERESVSSSSNSDIAGHYRLLVNDSPTQKSSPRRPANSLIGPSGPGLIPAPRIDTIRVNVLPVGKKRRKGKALFVPDSMQEFYQAASEKLGFESSAPVRQVWNKVGKRFFGLLV